MICFESFFHDFFDSLLRRDVAVKRKLAQGVRSETVHDFQIFLAEFLQTGLDFVALFLQILNDLAVRIAFLFQAVGTQPRAHVRAR